MAMTLLLLLGAVYAISTVVVFGAFFAALRDEKMAGGVGPSRKEVAPESDVSARDPVQHPVQRLPVAPPPAKFVHRMEREAISQPAIEASDDSWAALKLLGKMTVAHDEMEDARHPR